MENPGRPNKTLPLICAPQIVPSQRCLSCEVCCRFPERHSAFRPFFTEAEIQHAIARGIEARHFSNFAGSQVEPVLNPSGEGYICPAFDPETAHCRIYHVRPLDCQIYPFVVMWDEEREVVHLGWDTKCPFLIEQCSSPEINQASPGGATRAYAFPDTLSRFSQTMAGRVESPDMITILSANPQLVMEFQDDVVMIQKLPLLTKRLAES